MSTELWVVEQGQLGVLLDGRAEDEGDGVVQEALAQDQAVQRRVNVYVLLFRSEGILKWRHADFETPF